MNMKKLQKWMIRIPLLTVAALLTVSCVTNRKVAYLQDMTHTSQIELENRFEAVISPYDELEIVVGSSDNELSRPFNLRSVRQNDAGQGNHPLYYLVDQNGDFEMPVLGSIHAGGLTRLQLQAKIRKMLLDGNYLSDPFVMVRFQNYKIFMLGSNGGKAITITNERCTFLEALALSGDLNVFTDRSKIAVMREVDGKMVMRYLDPRSSKVFDDPFFMLQQNDFIITRNKSYKNFLETSNQIAPVLSFVSSIVSLGSLAASLILVSKNKQQ